jgi:membrane-bound inhibitor of C-type lysozyme
MFQTKDANNVVTVDVINASASKFVRSAICFATAGETAVLLTNEAFHGCK